MKYKINWKLNTMTIFFDNGQEIELTYHQFEELRKLLNEVYNDK